MEKGSSVDREFELIHISPWGSTLSAAVPNSFMPSQRVRYSYSPRALCLLGERTLVESF